MSAPGHVMTSIPVAVRRHAGPAEWPGVTLRWTGAALVAASWASAAIFGAYILALYGGAGHAHGFDGPFDVVMAFFFYLPNLAVAELCVRARRAPAGAGLRVLASVVLGGATGVLVLGTYYFTRLYWGPGIAGRVAGG